nr:MAG TPA: hypothetical protein [Caudoviricetes sp.]
MSLLYTKLSAQSIDHMHKIKCIYLAIFIHLNLCTFDDILNTME